MKKLFTLACAVVLTASAAAQITTQPEGTVYDSLTGTAQARLLKGWIGHEDVVRNGMAGKIVEGTDGNLYFNRPLTGHSNANAWVKLTKIAEGRYRLLLPQILEKVQTSEGESKYTLNRYQLNSENNYVVDTNNNFVDYTWDGTTLQMQGWDNSHTLLGESYDGVWHNVGDWVQSYTKLHTTPIEPSTNARRLTYQLKHKNSPTPYNVEIAMDGFTTLYIKNLTGRSKFADTWVKLTMDRQGKYQLASGQYLGISQATDFTTYAADNAPYHTYAVASEADSSSVAFTYDRLTHQLRAEGNINITFGINNTSEKMKVLSLDSIVLTPVRSNTAAGQPQKPVLQVCYARTNENVYYTNVFQFFVSNQDVNGNLLDENKLYYNVFVNGSTTPFTFRRLDYEHIEQDMTNIPYNYKDKWNWDIKIGPTPENLRIFHIYGNNDDKLISKLAVQLVYQDGGTIFKSEILEADVQNAPTPDAITSISSNEGTTSTIYGTDGRQRQELQKGINLLKQHNGTWRKIIVQ